MHLTINLNKKEGKIAKPTDRLSSIQIQLPDEYIEIKKESEADTIKNLFSKLAKRLILILYLLTMEIHLLFLI
jgi:hypothetical protein